MVARSRLELATCWLFMMSWSTAGWIMIWSVQPCAFANAALLLFGCEIRVRSIGPSTYPIVRMSYVVRNSGVVDDGAVVLASIRSRLRDQIRTRWLTLRRVRERH